MIIHESVSDTLMLKCVPDHLQELRTDVGVAVQSLLELQKREVQRVQQFGVGKRGEHLLKVGVR